MHRDTRLLAGSAILTVLAEFGMKSMTGTTVTGMLMSSTGMGALPAMGLSVMVWGIGMTAANQVARRGLSVLGSGLGVAAAHAREGAGTGLKAVRMFIADKANFSRDPVRHTDLTQTNPTNLAAVVATAREQNRPILIDSLMTQDGWRDFMEATKAKQIRVVDLDSLDETKGSQTARAFPDPVRAMAEIQKSRTSAPIEPLEAEKILDRIVRSEFDSEDKKLLYKALSNESKFASERIAEARTVRDANALKAELAITDRDTASLGRLKENSEIEAILKDSKIFRDDDRIVQILQRSVHEVGVGRTLELLESDPGTRLQDEPVESGGVTRQGPSVADLLTSEPEMGRAMRDYVTNIGAVRRNADEIVALKSRQAALEAHMLAQEEALARVERRIEREVQLLDPMTQRQVLADSLKAVTEARESNVNTLTERGVKTGESEIAAVEGASADGHGGAEQIALAFSHIATRVDARFSEAHLGPVQGIVKAAMDSGIAVTRGGSDIRRDEAGAPRSQPIPRTEERMPTREREVPLRDLVARETHALEEMAVVQGFGGDTQPKRSGGRDIRTRTRRRSGAEMEA